MEKHATIVTKKCLKIMVANNMNVDLSLIPGDTVLLLLTDHSINRFVERYNIPCDIDNLNSQFSEGYFLKYDGIDYRELYIYFSNNNELVSIDNKELPDRTFVVKTFIPRNGKYIDSFNGIHVNVVWDYMNIRK